MTINPTAEDAVRNVAKAETGCIHVSYIGRVINFDRDKNTCTIQPTVRSRYVDDSGLENFRLPPPIYDVPIQWPGGSILSFDIPDGAYVLCVVADRSLDEWLHTGSSDNIATDRRRWSFQDSVVVGGVSPFNDPRDPNTYADGATVLNGDDVRLGDGTATDYVALASLVEAEFQKIVSAINNAVGLVVPGDGGAVALASIVTALNLPSPAGLGSVAADKVKAT